MKVMFLKRSNVLSFSNKSNIKLNLIYFIIIIQNIFILMKYHFCFTNIVFIYLNLTDFLASKYKSNVPYISSFIQ